MRLKLKHLQSVVESVANEERSSGSFREEITRVLGPTVLTTHGLKRLAESANDILDIIERTGRTRPTADLGVLKHYMKSKDPSVRKLVARLLPERALVRMMEDPHAAVRAAVASRLPTHLVSEMVAARPYDEMLREIERKKIIAEGGLATPKVQDEEFDMYGDFHMQDAYDDLPEEELSDTWYSVTAEKIVKDYGGNLEGQWEEIAVKRFCDSMKTYDVEIDYNKLLDNVYGVLADREDAIMGESLKVFSNKLRSQQMMEEAFMPMIPEKTDSVRDLLSSGLSGQEYSHRFEEVFSVKKANLENPGNKYGLTEGAKTVLCPVSAVSPTGALRADEERAADKYAKIWNSQKALQNRNYRLNWSPHPESQAKISFNLEIK